MLSFRSHSSAVSNCKSAVQSRTAKNDPAWIFKWTPVGRAASKVEYWFFWEIPCLFTYSCDKEEKSTNKKMLIKILNIKKNLVQLVHLQVHPCTAILNPLLITRYFYGIDYSCASLIISISLQTDYKRITNVKIYLNMYNLRLVD